MAHKRKTTGPLRGFAFEQPFIGFRTQFRTTPLKTAKAQLHNINYGGTCREELIWDTREFLQSKTVRWKTNRGTWKQTPQVTHTIDLNHRSLKQPLVTYLWYNEGEDWGFSKEIGFCRQTCCINKFIHLVDALVGPLVVVLNNDRYQGDWWATSAGEAFSERAPGYGTEVRWYGTDNFFLRHPVLTSLVMGMFRQAILLYEQNFGDAILRAVDRKDVEECLTYGDPDLALKILTRLRPWVAVTNKYMRDSFPFPAVYWHRLQQLKQAIHKHGYHKLFGGDLQTGWSLGQEAEEGGNSRYAVCSGPIKYWGTTGSKLTDAGRLLAKLGK